MNIDTSRWITQREMSRLCKCSIQCVHNWIKREKVDFIKIKMGIRGLTLVDKYSLKIKNNKL